MTHPLLASLATAFQTMAVPQSALKDAVTGHISEWAGIAYDPASTDWEYDYQESEKILCHEGMMRLFVDCTRDLVLKKGISARRVAIDVFSRDKSRFIYGQYCQCHQTMLQDLTHGMNGYQGRNRMIEPALYGDEARLAKQANRALMDDFRQLPDELFLRYDEMADEADHAIFLSHAMVLMRGGYAEGMGNPNRLLKRRNRSVGFYKDEWNKGP